LVVTDEGSQALLKNNRIYDGKDAGFYIDDKATATLEDNDIHSNTEPGVHVTDEGSQALLKNNRIHDGKDMQVSILVAKLQPVWRTMICTRMQRER
jgi:parallel beta-helix repeat protein